MSFTTLNPSLKDIPLSQLQQEIERRSEIHKFSIDDVEFELTLEQVKKLQKELDKINPIKNPWDEYAKRLRDTTPCDKLIQPPIDPYRRYKEPHISPPYPPYPPITCQADRVF